MPATFACAYYTNACDTLVPQALVNIRLERESPRLSCLDCGVAADLLAHGEDGGQIEVHREVPVGALEVDELGARALLAAGKIDEGLGTRAQARHRRQRVTALGADEHVYFVDFSSNKVQTALYPSSSMAKLTREMLSLNDPNLLRTVPLNGTSLVRHATSEHLARYRGMGVDPDQIIVGSSIEYLYSRLM